MSPSQVTGLTVAAIGVVGLGALVWLSLRADRCLFSGDIALAERWARAARTVARFKADMHALVMVGTVLAFTA